MNVFKRKKKGKIPYIEKYPTLKIHEARVISLKR